MDEITPLIDSQEQPLIFDNTNNTNNPNNNIKVYKRRWLMLLVLTLLNLSSGMMWMSFSDIADVTSLYYKATTLQVNWLSIVFMLATILLGLPCIWLLDKHGLRTVFHIASLLNVVGSFLRLFSTFSCFHDDKNNAYIVLLIGQTLSGCAQPFILPSSTKLAAVWFPPHQRTTANMIAATANPVGILLGSLLSTIIVTNTRDDDVIQRQMMLMLSVAMVLCVLTFLITLFVTTPIPPTPPSFSASERVDEFWVGLKKLFTNKDYLLLAISYGSGVGLISSLVTITDQLLLPYGYSDKFCGLVTSLLFGFGLLGAFAFSTAADKLLKHEAMAKIAFSLGSSFLILFVTLTRFANFDVYLAVSISAAGVFCLSLNPLCLELGVESSFPVSEGTSGGILVLFGQVMACLFTFLLSIASKTTPSNIPHDGGDGDGGDASQDIISKYAMLGFTLVTFLSDVVFVIFYRCPFIRRQFEERKEAERVMRKMRESEDLSTPII